MPRVLIMRGIPGSGKSTQAKRWATLVPGAVIVSTDHYMFAGDQVFDHTRLLFCNEQCQTDYEAELKAGTPLVIVDNTNTKYSSITPYTDLAVKYGYDFTILQLHVAPKVAAARGKHPVPMDTLVLYAKHMWFERLPEDWDVWNYGRPWEPPKEPRKPRTGAEVLLRREGGDR